MGEWSLDGPEADQQGDIEAAETGRYQCAQRDPGCLGAGLPWAGF